MRFEWVKVRAFGPLLNRELNFEPGLNLICGPNEAGKSSWHAALYAALCGRRRGPGRPGDDRRFAERHRPWSGDEWRVGTNLTLANGRVVELNHDLDGGVDCQAIEHPTGRDVSNEIMNDGAPDGAVWLGLDRRSFLAVACVRQGEVLQIRVEADSLQAHLQRAATSVSATSTAAEALRIIDAFRGDKVGSYRAPTKPLVTMTDRLQTARRDLELAEQSQRDFLAIHEEVEAQEREVSSAERRLLLVEGRIAEHQASELAARLAKATELKALFPSGEPHDLVDDAAMIGRIATALRDWDQRPHETALPGESIEAIEQLLQTVPDVGVGDLEEDEGVRAAGEEYRLTARLLDEHRMRRPSQTPSPDTGGLDSQTLRNLARDLEISARRMAPEAASRTNLSLIAGLAVLAIGIILFLIGATFPGALLALAGGGWAAYSLLTRRGIATGTSPAPDPSHLGRLTAVGQAIEPDALRALADIYEAALRDQAAFASWSAGEDEVVVHLEEIGRGLMANIESRGVASQAGETPDRTLDRYREQYRLRKQRFDLLHQLEILHLRMDAESSLRETAGLAGMDSEGESDMLVRGLREWQEQRKQHLEELDEARSGWTGYQTTLGGLTIEDLETEASRRRNAADVLLAPFANTEIEAVVIEKDVDDQLAALRKKEVGARADLARLQQRLHDHSERMPDVAAAAEDLQLAEAELQRLRDLDRILGRTRGFLNEAATRAHLNIAPVLQTTLQRWLPVVTYGRYVDALVNPESLEVKVRSEGGSWRPADSLSHGTSEQVYLLLRVALAEHLANSGEPCPLILDDVTAQSDAERTAAILDALAAISSTRQVIFFSQEAEVLEWARHNGGEAHLIELPVLEPAR